MEKIVYTVHERMLVLIQQRLQLFWVTINGRDLTNRAEVLETGLFSLLLAFWPYVGHKKLRYTRKRILVALAVST